MSMNLPFRISICGLDELSGHRQSRVSHVLSILDPDWPVPEVFGQYGEHAKCELRFHDIIDERPGLIAPQVDHVATLLTFGRALAGEPAPDAHLLVHCHAGVSRSTASMALLVAQARPATKGSSIFEEILRIRPQAWPNLRLLEMGDAMLERGGELVAAVTELYRRQLAQRPWLAEEMQAGGRGREVTAARVG